MTNLKKKIDYFDQFALWICGRIFLIEKSIHTKQFEPFDIFMSKQDIKRNRPQLFIVKSNTQDEKKTT